MKIVEKTPIKNSAGINIGTLIKLHGLIGYETPTQDFVSYDETMKELDTLIRSDVVAIDVTSLKRWDTLGLRSIYPRLQRINKELQNKGKAPVVIIGADDKDTYDAAIERYPNSETQVPWTDSLESFLKRYNLY